MIVNKAEAVQMAKSRTEVRLFASALKHTQLTTKCKLVC